MASILVRKCAVRGVSILTLDEVFDPVLLDLVRREWGRTLGPFIQPLPDVEVVLRETREQLESVLRL